MEAQMEHQNQPPIQYWQPYLNSSNAGHNYPLQSPPVQHCCYYLQPLQDETSSSSTISNVPSPSMVSPSPAENESQAKKKRGRKGLKHEKRFFNPMIMQASEK